jgi:hypothetical protein
MDDPELLLGKVLEWSGHDALRGNSIPAMEMVSETTKNISQYNR